MIQEQGPLKTSTIMVYFPIFCFFLAFFGYHVIYIYTHTRMSRTIWHWSSVLTCILPLNVMLLPQLFLEGLVQKKWIKACWGKPQKAGVWEFTGFSVLIPFNDTLLPQRFLIKSSQFKNSEPPWARSMCILMKFCLPRNGGSSFPPQNGIFYREK